MAGNGVQLKSVPSEKRSFWSYARLLFRPLLTAKECTQYDTQKTSSTPQFFNSEFIPQLINVVYSSHEST